MSNEATLAAGTLVKYSLDLDTPAYTQIPKILSIGALGLMAEAKESTTLSSTQKEYSHGLQDAPDKTIKGQFLGSDADQKAFIAACRAKTPMMIQVTYPDKPDATGTGTVADFLFKPLGFEMDDVTAEDFMMFTVNGKQNSAVSWTDPVAGA